MGGEGSDAGAASGGAFLQAVTARRPASVR